MRPHLGSLLSSRSRTFGSPAMLPRPNCTRIWSTIGTKCSILASSSVTWCDDNQGVFGGGGRAASGDTLLAAYLLLQVLSETSCFRGSLARL